MLSDVSRHTVTRAEVWAGAALTAVSKKFHEAMRFHLNNADDLRLRVIAFRGDATNSAVWQRRKLQGLQVVTSYLVDTAFSSFEKGWWGDSMEELTCWPDVLPVEDSSGVGAMSLVKKQLDSVDCPSWEESLQRWKSGQWTKNDIELFLYCSDCGPDQVLMGKMIQALLLPVPFAIWIHSPCFAHQGQLIVKTGIARIDTFLKQIQRKWRYFASLTKLVHCWRDRCREMFVAWKSFHGICHAQQFAKKLPPRCIAGRWLSVGTTEARLALIGSSPCERRAILVPVLESVLKHQAADSSNPLEDPEADPDALVQFEEMRAYKHKMGRWSRDVLASTDDLLLWIVMDMAWKSRGPVEHLIKFIQSQHGGSKIESELGGSDAESEVGPSGAIFKLVTGKASKMFDEFSSMLGDPTFWNAKDVQLLDPALQPEVCALGTALVLCHAAGFQRRILRPLSQFPFQLLWLVKAAPGIACSDRRRAALNSGHQKIALIITTLDPANYQLIDNNLMNSQKDY